MKALIIATLITLSTLANAAQSDSSVQSCINAEVEASQVEGYEADESEVREYCERGE